MIPFLSRAAGWLVTSEKQGALRGSILTTPFALFGREHPSLKRQNCPNYAWMEMQIAINGAA
jgi:hypothetical protein